MPNISVIGSTTAGDVFGGFHSVAVTEQLECFLDPNIFIGTNAQFDLLKV